MFLSKFVRKNDKFGHLNSILGKLGVTHDLGWWLFGKPMHVRLSIALTELFSYLLQFRNYEAKCVQLGCFHEGRPLCTQLLSRQGRLPSTILGTRKPGKLCYPAVKTASFCVLSFWHNTGVWQTDGQRDMPPMKARVEYILIETRKTHIDQITLELQLQVIRVVRFQVIKYFQKFSGNFRKYLQKLEVITSIISFEFANIPAWEPR